MTYDASVAKLKGREALSIERAASSGAGPRFDVWVAGGKGDGATNNSAVFGEVLAAARDTTRALPYSLGPDRWGKVTIYVPPGDFVITSLQGLLGQEATAQKIHGLRFIGAGRGISNIIFKPATGGDLCFNDYWLDVHFEHLSFMAATADCTLWRCNTTHNAQRVKFMHCGFSGWKHLAYLEGSNNNSEYIWFDCDSSGIQTDGAWLKIPATGSDQFLNYHWISCKHWSSSAPLIDATLGGHFHIDELDASDWGSALTSTGYLINLRGASHAMGVCTLRATMRVEAKNAKAALLYSEWPQGNVEIDCDWSSQAYAFTYGDIITLNYLNVDGPNYTFKGQYAGGISVSYGLADWQKRHRIRIVDAKWLQKTCPTDVVTYTGGGPSASQLSCPIVEFEGVRFANTNAYSTDGVVIGDASVGSRYGEAVQTTAKREVRITGIYGSTKDGDTITFQLPLWALITDFQVIAAAGDLSQASGGTWTLATTDATPATVATATTASALNAGAVLGGALSVPFRCTTTARSKLTVKTSGITGYGQALVLVRGYW